MCYTECIIMSLLNESMSFVCELMCVCAVVCEERMRLPACMLSSLTTILTCLFFKWVRMHAYLSVSVCV